MVHMQFSHDNMTGAFLAADLVNAAGGQAWSTAEAELILRDHAIRRAKVDKATSAALRRWSAKLRTVFAATGEADRCDAINAILADGTTSVYLTTHDGLRPHLHFTPEDDDLLGRVMAVTAGGLAIFTVEADGHRLGTCALPGCTRVFVDTSRNGRRAYCTARCGNNDAVHRHRESRAT
jgi:predicted RNA-binding Zn ribbon-like protein